MAIKTYKAHIYIRKSRGGALARIMKRNVNASNIDYAQKKASKIANAYTSKSKKGWVASVDWVKRSK